MEQSFHKQISRYNIIIFQASAIVHLISLLVLQSDELLDTYIHIPKLILDLFEHARNISFYIISFNICLKGLYFFHEEQKHHTLLKKINSHLFVVSGLIFFFILSYLDKELENKLLFLGQQLKANSPLPLKIILFCFIAYKMITSIKKDILYSKQDLHPRQVKQDFLNFLVKTVAIILGISAYLKILGHHAISMHLLYFIYDVIVHTLLVGVILYGLFILRHLLPTPVHRWTKWLVSKIF
jgi:hypothetical protein